MMIDFESRGIKLPKQIGLYETQDENNTTFGGIVEKILRLPLMNKIMRMSPNPEADFGLMKETGEKKEILKGNRHRPEVPGEESQLKKVIRRMNKR